MHTYNLFAHVYVWYVARGPDHSRHAFIDNVGGVGQSHPSTRVGRGHMSLPSNICREGGEIRGGSNDDPRITESERENTQEKHTMRIYANEKQTT